MNILLVDDQPTNLVALEATLADLGLGLVRAGSGVEALARLHGRDFAAILLDVQMPGMDGFETARHIRDRDRLRHTPIIFIADFADDPNFSPADAYALGAVDYLVKPLVPVILRAKVMGFVELFRKAAQLERRAELLRVEERRRREAEREKETAIALREKAEEMARLDREFRQEGEARMPAEAAGQAAEDHLRLLVENATDYAIFTTDPIGRIVTWAMGAERVLGYTEPEALGRDVAMLYTPEDIEREVPQRERETAAVTGRAEDERWHVRKDGSRLWSSGVVSPLRDEARDLRGFGKVMRDLTRRKLAEDELAASEARFRSIAEQTPVLIWRADARGHYDYFNRPWYDFTGRGPEQEVGDGLGWVEGIHPDDRRRYLDTYTAAFARREPFEAIFRLRRHDGQYRWVTDRGAPFSDPAGTFLGYLGSCLDITERVGLEEALRQQQELAEEASRHKTRLMSALSHDARTPLNAVVLAAESLGMHLADRPDPEVEQDLRIIRHAVRNVLDLLGDLLNLVKIDAGATPTVVARFPLEQALVECLSGIEPQARQKGLDVRLEPGELAGSALETDRAKLKQILSNLLSNALRYTEEGYIRLYATRADDQVWIAVEDTGIGIAGADQPRIFEEFATLDKPHRAVGEGTGLGLAICRRLASLLGGEITLRSTVGQGSTFTLALPASVLTADRTAHEEGLAAPATGSGMILVVEDDLTSRQALSRILRRLGYRVREAANGRDALAQASQEQPSAILMDVNMPIMDGIEATLALRNGPATREVPIFALTGDVTEVNRRRIGEAGVDGYLEKPVSWDALKQALATLQGGTR